MKPKGVIRTRAQNIRLDEAGPELECRWCAEFWPLTRDYWHITSALKVQADRCRSCENERGKLRHALMALDPDYVENQRRRARRYRSDIRRKHPELLDAYDRDRRGIEREYQRGKRERRIAA